MRVVLREDGPGGDRGARAAASVALDDDLRPDGRCCASGPDDSTASLPQATVAARTGHYRDADGTQHWQWTDVATVPVLLTVTREEVDDDTGQSRITATGTLGWTADLDWPGETAEVRVDGATWSVVESVPLPGAVRVKLERLTDAE
ncbi:hypothetical protein ACFXGA_06140 [Actinosynnema sp. NPDC059335]|uniref:hypothetical protein n=1 Tax=Actinosynnema sp. NPDC059335 TaxID=3346804 RepID=UPI0036715F17